tara:strand:- start:291 stop:1040 length:750 start_codon:yes stop_codon:yes gene_type:complete
MNHYQLNFFGDSFTAGDELLDYQHYDNYPTPCNYHELKNQTWYETNPKIWDKLTEQEYKKHIIKQKQKSYAGIVGGTNHGISGTSLQSIARNIILYLENTDKESIIFLQPTGIERWCEYINGGWKDFVVNATYEDDVSKYFKFKVTHNTEYSRLVNWYNTLVTLISYIKNHKNTIDWYLINNGTFNFLTSLIKDNNFDSMFLNTFNELKNKTINFPQVDNTEAPYFCPGGHVNQKAHNELAEEIIKVLK